VFYPPNYGYGNIQTALDAYCKDTVQNENKNCVGALYARKGLDESGSGPVWRCYYNLLDASGINCVDDNGEDAECQAPNPADGLYCSRDADLTAQISIAIKAAHTPNCPLMKNQNLYSYDSVLDQKTDTAEECADLCRPLNNAVAWKWHDKTLGQYAFSCACLGSYTQKVDQSGVYSETQECKDCEVWKNNNLYSYDSLLNDKTDTYQECSALCSTVKESVAWKWHDSTKGKWANGCYCLGSYTKKVGESGVFSASRNC